MWHWRKMGQCTLGRTLSHIDDETRENLKVFDF